MALDEGRVAAGEKFLRHPQVQDAPLSQKMRFLESKGLSAAEIQEATKRADGHAQSVPLPPQALQPYTLPSPLLAPPPPLWLRFLLPGSILSGFALAALAIHSAYGDYRAAKEAEKAEEAARRQDATERRLQALAEGTFGDEELDLDGGEGDVERLCRSVARLSRTVARQDEVIRQNNAILARLVAQTESWSAVQVASGAAQEMRGDIKELRQMLQRATGCGSCDANAGPALSPVEEAHGEGSRKETERRQAIAAALDRLRSENNAATLAQGGPFLSKLIHNLTLGIPRYRRFPKSNESYDKFLKPLEGSGDLMEACGMHDKGTAFEWTWAAEQDADKPSVDALLQEAVDGLKAVVKSSASSAPSEEDDRGQGEEAQEEQAP